MITTQQAVMSLRPGAEWTMNGDDVENIIWHTEGVTPLTQQEVEDEMVRLQELANNEIATKEANRKSAVEKLSTLGLTEDEISALLDGMK